MENGSPLLLRIEHIKYRLTGPGKSPIGTLYIHSDRVRWSQSATEEKIIPFGRITLQRVSPPEKDKVQLQIQMTEGEQATFVFTNPAMDKAAQLKERDLVKDALQAALIQHRKETSQRSRSSEQSESMQAKQRLLETNPQLLALYAHLVNENLITPDDFWSFHKPGEQETSVEDGVVGISGGFLSSLTESGSGYGIKVNLTRERIHEIFRIYPAVERKHLELVPHEMTDQEFWTKFLTSHYFHRSHRPETAVNDPFADCVKLDEIDMSKLLEEGEGSVQRQRNLTSLDDDLGIISEMRDNNIPVRSNAAKATLVRRCNYHSGKVLDTMKHPSASIPNGNATTTNGEGEPMEEATPAVDGPSTSQGGFDLILESGELESMKNGEGTVSRTLDLKIKELGASRQCYPPVESKRHKKTMLSLCSQPSMSSGSMVRFFDRISEVQETDEVGHQRMANGTLAGGGDRLFEGLTLQQIDDVRVIHACSAELLRHFWRCFPAQTSELKQKATKVHQSLQRFEKTQLRQCEERYGSRFVTHCREMLEKAYQYYTSVIQAEERKK